ncbi:S8 family serine peptidase [Sutcliffiella horikoshii]|uniref:S8 family serine peptidase n=1 Tax=Sutcliffiella horikoshii TaxID=79883 RepID=UPI001CBB6338|nr:S8 family serine peptidase [Sutcliffiella horikoshii]UAL45544.1 S8 family serine peptidase [Sutcliffiella horikoshii]
MKKNILFTLSFIIFFSVSMLLFYYSNFNTSNSNLVKVAILDSGINQDHKFFSNINFKSYNAIDNNSKYTEDNYNHGTGIASLIVDPLSKKDRSNVVVYNVKVINDNGIGKPSCMLGGLKWAIKEEVDIINISAGFQTNNPEIKKLISQAYEKGIVVIASAGNNLGFEVDYPAKLNQVISISSISQSKTQSLTSSTGKIDFVSIGEGVKVANNKNTYEVRNGSSFATAKVTAYLLHNMIKNGNLRGYEKSYHFLLDTADSSISKENSIFGNGYIE